MNLANWIALTMVSWTYMHMNSIRTQLTISYQCLFGLFRTTKFLKSSYKLLYFSLGQPWDKTCIIDFICTIFQFPSLIDLFTCAKTNLNPYKHIITCSSSEYNHVQCIPHLFSPPTLAYPLLQFYDPSFFLICPTYIQWFFHCSQSMRTPYTSPHF